MDKAKVLKCFSDRFLEHYKDQDPIAHLIVDILSHGGDPYDLIEQLFDNSLRLIDELDQMMDDRVTIHIISNNQLN